MFCCHKIEELECDAARFGIAQAIFRGNLTAQISEWTSLAHAYSNEPGHGGSQADDRPWRGSCQEGVVYRFAVKENGHDSFDDICFIQFTCLYQDVLH